MTPLNRLKMPLGTAKFCRLRNARYLTWRDASEVEFEDGIAFLETHQAIRRANKINRNAVPVRVKLERQTQSGFFVQYDDGRSTVVIRPGTAARAIFCRRNGADGNRAT